ncbi:MAG: hypothetical protein ACI4HO_08750 [Ruminococcus sp.]
MRLEDLIYNRLTSSAALAQLLTQYNGEPAVFYQLAPEDTQTGWDGRKQYPRIDYIVDYQADPERKTSGVLSLNIWSPQTGTPPEEIEPLVRELLTDVFLKPEGGPFYALSWARTDAFESKAQAEKDVAGIVLGASVTFDVFAFPSQETTDPDPVQALNIYAKQLTPEGIVIGTHGEPDTIAEPRENAPVLYFRLDKLQTNRETNTVVWMDATIAGHVFARGEEIKWIRAIADTIARDGEVPLTDGSPLFIKKISADSSQSALTKGQLALTVQFGLLRRGQIGHRLNNAEF